MKNIVLAISAVIISAVSMYAQKKYDVIGIITGWCKKAISCCKKKKECDAPAENDGEDK